MRTPDEILARIKEVEREDFFGFQRDDLLNFLPFNYAKPFLREFVTEEEWSKIQLSDPLKEIRDYMPFAWDKANHCRGLSAHRSLEHMKAWLWLAGEDELLPHLEDYQFYGKPQLQLICDHLNIPWQSLDDGIRTNTDDSV